MNGLRGKGVLLCVSLLFLSPGKSAPARALPADSLFSHYPDRPGNKWDYDGDIPFLWGYSYPAWHLFTATRDSLHPNGKKYRVIELVRYEMEGQSRAGALGTIWRRTILQRVDSATGNVYRIDPANDAAGEFLFDSLRAQAGDTLKGSPGGMMLIGTKRLFLFGKGRWVRQLGTSTALVYFGFSTAEGVGILSYGGGEPVGPTFGLQGAVIDGDTLGRPLRFLSPNLQVAPGSLQFSSRQPQQDLSFANAGAGLAIIDSVAMNQETYFSSQPYYHGLGYAHTFFSRGPFLVFPRDSIHLLLILRQSAWNSSFADTFRVFSRDVEGRRLPELRVPVRVDAISALQQDSPTNSKLPSYYELRVAPNPASSRSFVWVRFRLWRPEAIQLAVLDILGRRLLTKSWPYLAAGQHKYSLDVRNWHSGVYFVRLRGKEHTELMKWRVIR